MSFPQTQLPDPGLPQPGPAPVPAKPGRRRTRWIWGVPLLLAGAAAFLHFRGAQEASVTAGGGPEIATVAISMGNIDSTVRVAGTIVAERSAIIRAPRIMGSRGDLNRGGAHDRGSGPAGGGGGGGDFNLTLLMLSKPGTQVKAGDLIAQFDPQNQVQRLDDYSDSVVQLKNQIRRMMANLAASKETHEQKVRLAKADWQKAVLDEKTTPIRSVIDAEKMRLAVEEARLKYDELLGQQALVEESQQASIRASQLVLARSDIEMERARNNVDRMQMTSPIDGIVVMANLVINGELRPIREGDQVQAGQPVLYVVDASSMVLNASANQVDAERMRIGMRAQIKLDAYPALSLPATLIGVGAMAKVSTFRAAYVGEIPVRFRVDGRDSRLLPDLTGSADVIVGSESNVLVAPKPALFTENGRPFVFVRDGERWRRKPVETGLHSFTHFSIRTGLESGALVALQQPPDSL